MARPEQGLWEFLRSRLPVGTHYSRIESHDTAPGFPDVILTLKGKTLGMELKCQEFPTGECPFDEKNGLRRSQRMWIRDELEAGGKVILVLQHRQMIYFLEGHYFNELEHLDIGMIARRASVIWNKEDSINPDRLREFISSL